MAYQHQIGKDLDANKYLKAANISKNKMQDFPYAQEILMRGWKNKIDQYNCLRNYLDNIDDGKEVWEQLERIKREDIDAGNDTIFLKVLKDEFAKQDENENKIKNMAYVLLSELLEQERISPHSLLSFNRKNARLKADIMRYELKKNKRLK